MLQGFLRTIRKRGNMKKQYYCNPLNMDYRYQFIEDMRSGEDKISREAADPSMILFQGKYYIFASMTLSVWVSEDMVHWESHRLPDSLPLVRCETTRGDQVHSEAYYADETRSLRFEEQDNLDGWNVRAADARVLTIYLHSVPGYLIDRQTEDTHEVSIIWAEGKRMLRVTSIGLPADEAVLVAQSVKKIFAE